MSEPTFQRAFDLFERDPSRSVIACVFPPAHVPIHACGLKAPCCSGAQENVIDPQAGIARERVAQVLPERVDARVRMQRAQRIGPALRQQVRYAARLVAKQRIVHPARRRVHIRVKGTEVIKRINS